MKQLNPKWAAASNGSAIDLENEKMAAGFYEQTNFGSYRNSTYSSYAIGSPSVEMYMKAFNVYKTGNKNATNLIYKLDDTSRKLGYLVGANNSYANSGYHTNNNTIEPGPNNVFMTSGVCCWWLASPSSRGDDRVLYVYGGGIVTNSWYYGVYGVCPVVPLDL